MYLDLFGVVTLLSNHFTSGLLCQGPQIPPSKSELPSLSLWCCCWATVINASCPADTGTQPPCQKHIFSRVSTPSERWLQTAEQTEPDNSNLLKVKAALLLMLVVLGCVTHSNYCDTAGCCQHFKNIIFPNYHTSDCGLSDRSMRRGKGSAGRTAPSFAPLEW